MIYLNDRSGEPSHAATMSEFQALPELQECPDEMRPRGFAHLFGVNDAALSRLKNFSDGRNRLAVWTRYDLELIHAGTVIREESGREYALSLSKKIRMH